MHELLPFFMLLVVGFVALMRARSDAANIPDWFPIEDRIDALLRKEGVRYNPGTDMPTDVQDALRAGNKIEAIKLYRAARGVGLKEAKDAVEQTEGAGPRIQAKLDALLKSAGVSYDPAAGLQTAIDNAIRAGKKIEAIKLYRTATGVGLKEAKDAIETKMRGFS